MNEILILTRKWVEHRCLFTNIHVESIKINWRNFTIRKTISSFIQVKKHNRPITFALLKLTKNIQLIPVCIYTSSIYRVLILMRIFFNLFYHKRRNFQNCIISLCIYSTLNFYYKIFSCCNISIVEITYWKHQVFVKDIWTGKRLIYLDL